MVAEAICRAFVASLETRGREGEKGGEEVMGESKSLAVAPNADFFTRPSFGMTFHFKA